MAVSATLGDLISQARVSAGLEGADTVVADTALYAEAADLLEELIDDIVDASQAFEHFGKIATLTGANPLTLPADFYQLKDVFLGDSSLGAVRIAPLEPGQNSFARLADGSQSVTVEYIPTFDRTTFDAAGESYSGPPGWDAFVTNGLVAYLLDVQDLDSSAWMRRMAGAKARVTRAANRRVRDRVYRVASRSRLFDRTHYVNERGVRRHDARAYRVIGGELHIVETGVLP